MLDQALAIQDTSSITSTVARLPSTAVIPLLEAVLQRVHGKPARVATLVILSSPAQAVNCKCRPHLVSALVLSGVVAEGATCTARCLLDVMSTVAAIAHASVSADR